MGFVSVCRDVIMSIFSYLPAVIIKKFEKLSEDTYSDISTSYFKRLHGKNFPVCCFSMSYDSLFLLRAERPELNFMCLNSNLVTEMETITNTIKTFSSGELIRLSVCNGLLLLAYGLDGGDEEHMVYNPVTNQHNSIPNCEYAQNLNLLADGISICFDPRITDSYKLVGIWIDEQEETCFIFMYDSEMLLWNENEVRIEMEPTGFVFGQGRYWNGNMHWVSGWGDILCFDLEKQCILPVPDLPTDGDRGAVVYFGETAGSLYAMLMGSDPLLVRLFSMDNDYGGWSFNSRINLDPVYRVYPSMINNENCRRFQCIYFIWCMEHKKEELFLCLPGKIILYHLSDYSIKEAAYFDPVYDYDTMNNIYQWTETMAYTGTLSAI